jgi:Na+/melibiose symporter-like transporter
LFWYKYNTFGSFYFYRLTNQILDDFDQVQPEKSIPQIANWKYRTVGVFRLLISLIIFLAIYANIMDWYEPQQSGNTTQIESLDVPLIIFSIVITVLFTFPLIYHIRQGWAELRLEENLSQKRLFRVLGMMFTGLLIMSIFVLFLYFSINILTNGKSLIYNVFYSIAILLIIGLMLIIPVSVFWMDRQYRKYS